METKKWSTTWGGRELTVEVGKLALQANAACTVRYGETVILATIVKSKNIRDGIDYFPLTVEFEEKMYAAGKIKGSRFIKREGRPSDEAILSGRLIDRSIRPLFDERIRNDVQVVLTVLAIDGTNDATIAALFAASTVISISSVPWNGPIAAARIGLKDGSFVLNASPKEAEEGGMNLVVAGTPEKLVMVEAGVNEIPEDKMLEAMKWGCSELKPAIEFIEKIKKEIGQEKMTVEQAMALDEKSQAKAEAEKIVRDYIAEHVEDMIFDKPKMSRIERNTMLDKFEAEAKKILVEKEIASDIYTNVLKNVKLFVEEHITKRILDKEQRLDGRKITEIRPLTSEVDLLPRVHGSGMFMRGDTQILSVVTLGAPGDAQTIDGMEEDSIKRYMHHYNDAPFAYGEAGMMRGPGRRAIGHGALAERALVPVLPKQEDFPYAIRVVSEVLGSNGSSSMASTCGSTLSLMAAGVPIKKMVGGIAMGLASESDEKGEIKRFKVLTDLQDVEDGPGGMDFKMTGTRDGVTAMQMDTKTFGLTWEIVEQTLKQSKEARMQVLDVMEKAISEPRKELSPYAPRIETIRINPEKIGELIGPGGKTIKKITEETGVDIDIEQDGRVLVTSSDSVAMEKAKKMIDDITHEVTAGEIYDGTVVRLEDFGAFVQILPGKDGLVHVSEISWDRVGRPADVLKLGDKVKVQVKEIDNMNRVNLSIKVLLPKPEGWTPPPAFDRGGDRGGRSGGFGGQRRGGFVKRDR